MGFLINKIIAGDYKGANIKYKIIGKKLFLVNIGFLKSDIELNKYNVEHIELLDKSHSAFDVLGSKTVQAAIYFRDGKKSLASLSADTYQDLIRILF